MNDLGIYLPASLGMTSLFLWLITLDIEPEQVRWASQIPVALAIAVTLASRVTPGAGLWFLVQLAILNFLTAVLTPGSQTQATHEVISSSYPRELERRRHPRNR